LPLNAVAISHGEIVWHHPTGADDRQGVGGCPMVYGTPVQLPQHQLEAAADVIEAMNVNRQPCRAAAQP